nr:hypothetical protein [Tanacetum cinerariifolium]
MIEYHLVDMRLKDLMMVLVTHTEKYDMMLHMEKTGIWMLVVEANVGDMTADVVDKLSCASDVSHMELYIENRENGRMILNLFENDPLIWPTIEENGKIRKKKYKEHAVAEKLKADCDLKATNIFLQGLPPDVYAIVNHHKFSKEIRDRVKLLMQVQERQVQSYVGARNKGNATSSSVNNVGGQAKAVKCYNCQGKGHMARQCTQPKRPRNVAWFKEKAMLAEAHESEIKKSESCYKCLDLEAELVKKKNMDERDVYTKLSNRYAWLEKHCISLELDVQLNQQTFQKDKSCENQNALEFLEYFENNNLKAQLQEKDTTIYKLRNHIKSLREYDKNDRVKQELDEIETINIKLEHSMEFKSKNMLNNATTITIATTIVLRMFKLDLDPLAPRLLKNRDAHIDCLMYTYEQAYILRGIVKQAKVKQPLDNALNFSLPIVVALVLADLTGIPSSTSVDQDAPSPSTSQTPQETKSIILSSSVKEDNHDIEVAHIDIDQYFGILIP